MAFFDPFGIFGGGDYQDPARAADPYFNKIPGLLEKYMKPYMEAGQRQLGGLEDLQSFYKGMYEDPNAILSRVGAGYQQSPGFKFAMQQALQGAGHAAGAGGMAGSPQHEQQNMELATNLANQDYNTYLQNALGVMGQGLSGRAGIGQNIYGTGARAGMGLGEDLASVMGSRAKLAFEAANAENQRRQGMTGGLIGAGIQALPFLFS